MPRFYNAGHKIDERFAFSLPDGADIHFIGYWSFLAPKESWFDVPTEITVGNESIAVKFVKDIQRRFGKRGIVLLDPTYKQETEDSDKPLEFYPVAATEELVIERAEMLWENYLEELCKAHFEDVQNAMSSGGAPRAAKGFTAHALKLKNYRDPAHDYFLKMKEGNSQGGGFSPEVAAMMAASQRQTSALMGAVLAIASGQKLDPEVLKSMMAPNGTSAPAPITPPENAGEVDVDDVPRTSLEERIAGKKDDGWVKGEGNLDKGNLKTKAQALDRKERTATAARQL